MRAKWSLFVVVAMLTLAAFTTGCSQLGMRTDAQIASDVQSKINSDPSLTAKAITVQSGNGIVTLSGTVANDTERNVAANDAAQVSGVKTVVNNLQVGTTAAQAAPIAPPPQQVTEAPAPAPAYHPRPSASRSTHRVAPVSTRKVYNDEPVNNTNTSPVIPASSSTMASNAPTNVTMAPTAPPPPVRVTVPDGSMLSIRLVDAIDTEQNRAGDVFRATLDAPVVVDDRIVIPAGADVTGRIAEAQNAGHYVGRSQLALELTQISVNGHTYPIRTDQFTRQASSRSARTGKTMGGGAVLGAIIGGIAGGGKGAAIGAATGAGAGGAVETVTKPEPVKLPSETVVNFRLTEPVTVTASTSSDRVGRRQRMDPVDNDRPRNNDNDSDRPVLERRPPPPPTQSNDDQPVLQRRTPPNQ